MPCVLICWLYQEIIELPKKKTTRITSQVLKDGISSTRLKRYVVRKG